MTEPIVANYPAIRSKLVAKKDAIRFAINYMPLEGTRELQIFWPVNDDKLMQECLRFMDDYGGSDGVKGQTWVDDPIASNELYPGRWRVVNNRLSRQNEDPGVYQTLREGLFRTLSTTEDANNEARLVKYSIDPQNGKMVITRQWIGIDPSYDEAILTARRAVKTRTNVYLEGQLYSGTFAVSEVHNEPMPDDGAIALFETLTEITTIASIANLTALVPLIKEDLSTKEFAEAQITWTNISPASRVWLTETMTDSDATGLVKVIKDLFFTALPGSGWTWVYCNRDFTELKDNTATFVVIVKRVYTVTAYADLDNIHSDLIRSNEAVDQLSVNANFVGELDSVSVVWRNVSLDSRVYLSETATDALLINEIHVIYPTTIDFTYFDRKFQTMPDNTATFTVIIKKPVWLNYKSADPATAGLKVQARMITGDTNKVAGKDIRQSDVAKGIPIANLETVRAAVTAESGYVVDSIQAVDNKDGSGTLHRNQTKIQSTIFTAQIYNRYTPEIGNSEETETYIWVNVANADALLIMADAKLKALVTSTCQYQPSLPNHVLKHVTQNDHMNGLSDVVRETYKPFGGSIGVAEAYFADQYFNVIKYIFNSAGTKYRTIIWKKWMGCAPTYNTSMNAIKAKIGIGESVKGSDKISHKGRMYYIWEVTLAPPTISAWEVI